MPTDSAHTDPVPSDPPPNGGAPNGGQGGTAVVPDPPDPPEVDGTELFFDDFDDGDAAGWVADVADGNDVVGDWQVVPGETGFVYQQGTQYGDATWTFAGDPTWTDQFLEADVAFLSTSDASADTVGEDGFIYFVLRRGPRAGSDDDYNYVFLEFRSDGQFRVRQRFEGSSSTVADWNNLGFLAMAGQWHKIGMKAQGTTLTIYYNDFEILDGVLDPGLGAGQIGFAVIDATVAIDNVKVTTP